MRGSDGFHAGEGLDAALRLPCLGRFGAEAFDVGAQVIDFALLLAPRRLLLGQCLGALAFVLGKLRFLGVVSPYLLTAAIGGWLSYGPYVDGPRPALDPRGTAKEEAEVARALRERGVKFAAAQYWLSYRLTFLFDEDPVVITLNPWEDRYPTYRQGFDRASTVAYIFHPSETRARIEDYEPRVRAQGGTVDRLDVSGFSLLINQRR